MIHNLPQPNFTLDAQVAVVTGGTGVLGRMMVQGLAAAGATVAVLGRRAEQAEAVAEQVRAAGGQALATPANVLDREALVAVREQLLERYSRIDILVNAAGGHHPGAVMAPGQSLGDLDLAAMQQVMDLNFFGTFLPTQIFAEPMAARGSGSVVLISSMAATRAVTRVAGYSAAKAAIESLTRWLAMTLAQQVGPRLRVNAIAPGFFVADQNRALLLEPDGSLTARGEAIIRNTPMGRFGEPEELLGALVFLASEASRFVTGAVIPVDGGFSVFSGV